MLVFQVAEYEMFWNWMINSIKLNNCVEWEVQMYDFYLLQ